MKKLLIFFIIFILVFSSISLNVSSEKTEENQESNEPKSSDRLPIINKLLQLRFNMGFIQPLALGRYFVRQLRPPVAIQAYPESVNLEYLNETEIEIGGKNENNTKWVPMVMVGSGWDWAWMTKQIKFSFEYVPPKNSSEDVWNVEFHPNTLVMNPNRENLNWPGAETPFKTNVSIMLKPSADPNYPTQDVVLKVNIYREEILDKFGILKGAPEYPRKYRDEYIEKASQMGISNIYWDTNQEIFVYNLIGKYFLFLMNAPLPMYDEYLESTVEILIRVNKYHQAEIEPPLPIEIEPYEVKSIPIKIKNIGSHIDTFNFNVKCSDESIVVTPPPALTLKPGEDGEALVGVAAQKTFYSIGSTTSIFVDAYPIDDPDTVFSNTVILTTTGVYTTGGTTVYAGLVLILLVIMLALVIYFFKKHKINLLNKPGGLWEFAKKKEHSDKQKKKKEIKPKEKIIEEKKEPVVEKKVEKKPIKQQPIVDKDKERKLREKEKVMLKLKREQEKQRKKM